MQKIVLLLFCNIFQILLQFMLFVIHYEHPTSKIRKTLNNKSTKYCHKLRKIHNLNSENSFVVLGKFKLSSKAIGTSSWYVKAAQLLPKKKTFPFPDLIFPYYWISMLHELQYILIFKADMWIFFCKSASKFRTIGKYIILDFHYFHKFCWNIENGKMDENSVEKLLSSLWNVEIGQENYLQ